MPVIREYQQQTRAPGPISQAEYSPNQFGAAEGRALENLGEAVGNTADMMAKRIDQENTSDVTAKLTKANADLAIDLQNTIRTAEPGDKKVFEEYQKRVEDTIGAIGDEANTITARSFFGEASARIKGQLSQTAANGQAELAGIKAVTDYTNTINNLSAAVMADPSSVQLQRELHLQAINNLVATGQLPRAKALELQTRGETELAKSSVRGWIQLNPDYAKEKLKQGAFDKELGADGKVQLFGEAEQAIRAKEIEIERRERQQEKLVKQRQQGTQNDFLQAMVDGKLTSKDILNSNLEAFGSGSKEQFLNMLKMANAPEQKLKTDADTMIQLYSRIHLPDGDPNKLIDENELNGYFGRGLSLTDLNHLRDEMQGKQTEAGQIENDMKRQVIEIAKGQLTKSNPLTGFKDPIGDEQMQRFMVNFMATYKEQRAAGVPPRDLLDPDSPKYLGKTISNYKRTNQQIMRDLAPRRAQTPGTGLTLTPSTAPAYAAPPKPAPPPRQPGESAPDYLKRIKGGG
jgi:hypothetical protein